MKATLISAHFMLAVLSIAGLIASFAVPVGHAAVAKRGNRAIIIDAAGSASGGSVTLNDARRRNRQALLAEAKKLDLNSPSWRPDDLRAIRALVQLMIAGNDEEHATKISARGDTGKSCAPPPLH